MLAKLPLFTRTRRVLRSAIDRLMTRALSYGWWRRRASSSVKLMVGSLTLVSQGRRLVIWTLCTICKQVFLTFLDELAIILRPTITFISLSRSLFSSSIGLLVPRQVLFSFLLLDGNVNTYSLAFCSNHPSACLVMLVLGRPLFA